MGDNQTIKEKKVLRHVDDFVEAGLALSDDKIVLEKVARRYATAVPRHLAARMNRGDKTAMALRAQYVPDRRELNHHGDESPDPIGDDAHTPLAGIIHRYPDRLLLMPHHSCAVYCRFCFRRAKVGPSGRALTADRLDKALDYIARTKSLREVILSGGDPMLMSPDRMRHILGFLDGCDHLDAIRIHSRIPVAAPHLIDGRRLRVLSRIQKALYIVIHCNHGGEIDIGAATLIRRLALSGIVLLGQSVLLKGVNDDADTLANLFQTMVRHRIKPYYLHHCDPAPGTAHFQTTIDDGQRLIHHLRGRISGLCQPRYMLDIPGGYGKVPLDMSWITPCADHPGQYRVLDCHGKSHIYRSYGETSRSDGACEAGTSSRGGAFAVARSKSSI